MIFFIHRGEIKPYLTAAILQAAVSDPEESIVVLSDQGPGAVPQALRHLRFATIADYSESADSFAKIFKFEGRNPKSYTLGNFQRWFLIEEFCVLNAITGPILHLDSDSYLFLSTAKISAGMKFGMSVCDEIGPQFTLFQRLDDLTLYTNYLHKQFFTDAGFVELQEFVAARKDFGLPHVSDMAAIGLFGATHQVDDLGKPDRSDFVFDENIGQPQGLRMGWLGKKIVRHGRNRFFVRPDGSRVLVGGVHLQGGNKASWPWFVSLDVHIGMAKSNPQEYGKSLVVSAEKLIQVLSVRLGSFVRRFLKAQ